MKIWCLPTPQEQPTRAARVRASLKLIKKKKLTVGRMRWVAQVDEKEEEGREGVGHCLIIRLSARN